MIRFLTNGIQLLELDTRQASASLPEAWEQIFGVPPHLGAGGYAVTGLHHPGRKPAEREVLLQCSARAGSIDQALRLLVLRHKLESIRIVKRPWGWWDTGPEAYDRASYLADRPYSLAAVSVWSPQALHAIRDHAVSVWPPEALHAIRDQVVIELVDQPGRFVCLGAEHHAPACSVEMAHAFQSADSAAGWIAQFGCEETMRIMYRSAALAEQDQAASKLIEDMLG